jgi:hypothetical protein
VARRPPDVDPAAWRAQRQLYWKRVNRVLNVLMVVAILLLLAQYFGWLPSLRR